MFPEMRRKAQSLDRAECERILAIGTHGVLACASEDGWPYAVPLSYACAGGRLYFHCAKEGQKLRALRREPKASFCVVECDDVVSERYTTHYRSVIVFGRVRELGADELRPALEILGRRYAPSGTPKELAAEIDGSIDNVCVLELTPEHITGKESRELMEQRHLQK